MRKWSKKKGRRFSSRTVRSRKRSSRRRHRISKYGSSRGGIRL